MKNSTLKWRQESFSAFKDFMEENREERYSDQRKD
jgi:hypothetical protein